jgi:hypothetical protein
VKKKMADCVPLEEEMLEALCWLCTTWNNYLDGLGLPFSFYQSFVCYLPIVSFYSVCVLWATFIYFWYFWYFFQENAAVRLPTATGMTTWSSRLLEEHTQFFRVSFVSVWQCRKVLVFHWWTEENVVSVCACVLLFYPFKRRRCDVQCLVMLTDTAFLDDAQ